MRGSAAFLGGTVVVWLVALVLWTGNDPELGRQFPAFSSHSTSPGGLSLAFSYLALRRGEASVRRLTGPIDGSQPPARTTIFRIGPTEVPAPKGASDHEALVSSNEEAWVRSGGRLVVALVARTAGISTHTAPCTPLRAAFPVDPPLPVFQSPHCRSLEGDGLQRYHSLLIDASGPVLARRPLGAGEILVFSMPEVLANEHLHQPGNLAMLERLAGNGRTVLFDETIHGFLQEDSWLDLVIDDWHAGPAVVLFAIAALASFWRRARSFGPPDWPVRDTRSDAVELVESLAQLYDRTVDREESLRLYHQGLVRLVHARTGLSGEPLDRLVRDNTPGYDPRPRYDDISREEFQRLLAILNRAYDTVGYANIR